MRPYERQAAFALYLAAFGVACPKDGGVRTVDVYMCNHNGMRVRIVLDERAAIIHCGNRTGHGANCYEALINWATVNESPEFVAEMVDQYVGELDRLIRLSDLATL